MITIYWIEAAIAILVVTLRIWGRVVIRQVGADDYVMIFTLVGFLHFVDCLKACCQPPKNMPDTQLQILFLILASISTYYASIGGLRHLFDLTADQLAFWIAPLGKVTRTQDLSLAIFGRRAVV